MATIRQVSDLTKEWPLLWPLILAGDRYHAELIGGQLRANIEHSSQKKLLAMLASNQGIVVLAEEDGELVGIGVGRILTSLSYPGARVGELSKGFIQPGSRGTGIVLQIGRVLEDWLRSRGVEEATGMVLAQTVRSLRLWRHLGYAEVQQIVRKNADLLAPGSVSPGAGLQMRRIEDPMAEWPRIWPLLQRRDGGASANWAILSLSDSESSHKERIRLLAAKKSRLLLAESDGQPVGLVFGRVTKNPWLIEERVGIIEDFAISADGEVETVGDFLVAEIQSWFVAKKVDSVQHTVMSTEVGFWHTRDFSAFFIGGYKKL